jgi:hypothetical protein
VSGEAASDAHSGPGAPVVESHAQARRSARSRLVSAAAFACAALAFSLPFGTASSCEGEKVSFTGVELVTSDVAPARSPGSTLHTSVESTVSPPATLVLLAVVVGLGLVLAGRKGGGVMASIGVFAMQWLALAVFVAGSGGSTLLVGFWTALVSLGVAGAAHLAERARARREAGRRVWTYLLGCCALAFSPTLAVVGLIAVAALESA